MNCDFLVSDGTTNDMRTQFFVEIRLFFALVRVEITLLQYTDLQRKQLIRHKFLEFEIATKVNQEHHKIWEEKTIRDLKQDCPEQDHSFLFDCRREKQFCLI